MLLSLGSQVEIESTNNSMAPISLNPPNQLSLESNVAQTLSLLEKCTNMMELLQIHARIYKTGFIIDHIPVSRLLTFSTSLDFGNLIYARKVFDKIGRRITFMWDTMIRRYSNSNEPKEALLLYH